MHLYTFTSFTQSATEEMLEAVGRHYWKGAAAC
jgi:hypothetical protein